MDKNSGAEMDAGSFWTRLFAAIRKLTGNVDVANKGDLQTQVDGLSEQVESCFQSASSGKALVAAAITGKGVDTSSVAAYAVMADNISKINDTASATADTDAAEGDILAGKKAYSQGAVRTGTMRDFAGETVDAGIIMQDDRYTYLLVQQAGYYDANSRIRISNSRIKITSETVMYKLPYRLGSSKGGLRV